MDQAPGADALIDEVVDYLKSSRSVLVITGAGLSADSGLPTYRGRGGLYDAFPAGEGLTMEQVLSAEGLNSDPARIWRHLGQVEHSCRGSRPNRGHAVIAAMEQEFERCWVLTQNIDGLHQQAGSHNVISIHGNLHEVRCCACDYQSRVRDYAELGTSPHCPSCGASLRPDVVLFGEHLNRKAVGLYEREIPEPFDMVFSIGTTSLFPYIREPVLDAALFDRPTVEINPEETEVSDVVTVRLPERAEACLERIWQRYGGTLP